MLVYKAMFKFLDEGVHGETLDFPGAITHGKTWRKPDYCWPVPW